MHIGLFFILSGLLIGYLGRNRRFGFWGFFFATMLFTPLVSLIMFFAATSSSRAGGTCNHQTPPNG